MFAYLFKVFNVFVSGEAIIGLTGPGGPWRTGWPGGGGSDPPQGAERHRYENCCFWDVRWQLVDVRQGFQTGFKTPPCQSSRPLHFIVSSPEQAYLIWQRANRFLSSWDAPFISEVICFGVNHLLEWNLLIHIGYYLTKTMPERKGYFLWDVFPNTCMG